MLIALVAALFGLLIGSFLNVCIYRMPRDRSVVRPRSHCPYCEHMISWYDNIPVLSWLLLRGKCRNCRAGISWRYPAVELLTAVLFAAGFLVFGPTAHAVKFCVFAAIQVALIFMDFEERILADEFTLGGTLAGVVAAWWAPPASGLLSVLLVTEINHRVLGLIESAFSAAFLAFVLWAIGALYRRLRGREGLGFGDVKLVACIGAFLGLSPALLAMAAGSVVGSVVGITYILAARKDARSYELPFGSFLGAGAVAVALFDPGQYVL